jgi:hypothetical protein
MVTSYFKIPASVGWFEENFILELSLYEKVVSYESTEPVVIVEAARLSTAFIV